MPNTLARNLPDKTAIFTAHSPTPPTRFTPLFGPYFPANPRPLQNGLCELAPTVTALLVLNAALVARNFELLATISRYDRTTGTSISRKRDVMAASAPDGVVLHLVPAQKKDIAPNVGSLPMSLASLLTSRQAQILHLVLAGHPSKNIAADLNISQRTVENHRAAIMRRTGATSLPALARMAVGADGSADCKALSSKCFATTASH